MLADHKSSFPAEQLNHSLILSSTILFVSFHHNFFFYRIFLHSSHSPFSPLSDRLLFLTRHSYINAILYIKQHLSLLTVKYSCIYSSPISGNMVSIENKLEEKYYMHSYGTIILRREVLEGYSYNDTTFTYHNCISFQYIWNYFIRKCLPQSEYKKIKIYNAKVNLPKYVYGIFITVNLG